MEPRTASWARVLRVGGVATVAGTLVLPIAIVVGRLFHDPVEVVGRPLVDGYSERAESASWMLFLIGTSLLGALASRRRWPPMVESLFAVAAPLPAAATLWEGSWPSLALYLVAGTAAFGAAARAPFNAGLLLWTAVFPWTTWHDAVLTAAIVAPLLALAVAAQALRSRPGVASALRATISATTVALVAAAGSETALAAAIGGAAALLGRPRTSGFQSGAWAAAAALMALPLLWLRFDRSSGDFAPALHVLAGAGLAAMATGVRPPSLPELWRLDHWPPLAAAAALVGICLGRPWCVAVLTPAFIIAWKARPSAGKAWLIAVLLPNAFLAIGPPPRSANRRRCGAARLALDAPALGVAGRRIGNDLLDVAPRLQSKLPGRLRAPLAVA